MAEEQRRTRRTFSAEFKRDAVGLVLTGGKSVAESDRVLETYDSTLGNWVKQGRIDRGQQEGLSTEERARLRELEQENAKLGLSVICSNEARPDSTGRCNGGVEFISGGAVVEGLAGSGVEFARDGVEVGLGVSG